MPYANLATGIRLYYEIHGEGEPVLLLPGTGFSCDVWRPYQVPFLSRDYKVIILDQRGVGRSEFKDIFLTVEQMAADVASLLTHLNISSVHVIGHSLGGRVAMEFSLSYPEKVRSLVMAASGSGPSIRAGESCYPLPSVNLMEELIELGFGKYIKHEITGTDTYFTAKYRQEYPEKAGEFWELAWPNHARLRPYLRQVYARHIWESTHRLGGLKVPVLLLIGKHDLTGNSHVPQTEAMAKRISGAELKMLEDQSHGYFWQDPQNANQIIMEWIQAHSKH